MIKKIFLIIVLTLFSTNLIAAGTDSTSKVKSDYDKAVTLTDAEQLGGAVTEQLADLFNEE